MGARPVCLKDSYEENMVFVGADLEMTCKGPTASVNLTRIKWSVIGNFNDNLIFVCPSETYGRCENIDGHSLDDQNSYTSSFTIKNLSLEDAREYVCEIRTIGEQKLCIFNLTIKEQPVGLTLIYENEGTAINSSFLKVRADVNTTIRCHANTSVYLQWYPDCSDLSSHGCHEGDPQNGSCILSFTPRASQNGTILTCRIENKDEATGYVNTSITLQVEVCVTHLEIFNCNPLDAIINDQTTLSCHTNTSNINLVLSTVSFSIDPVDASRAALTNATWGGPGTPYVAAYDQEGFVPSNITCCVSKTSLCPAVCSDVCLFDVHVYPPRIIHEDTKLISMEDGIYLFHCEEDAVPEAAISWSLSGRGFFGNTQFVTIDNQTLTIHPPLSNGIGGEEVTCKAGNFLGNDTYSISIVADISSCATAGTAEPWSTSRAGSHSHSSKTSSEQGHPPSTSGQDREQVSDAEDQDMCSVYMEMRPIAPVQQYMALLGGGATIEDEIGSYVSPSLTRKHNPKTAEKTFLGDPTYVNTEDILYDNTIMKTNDESSYSE